MSCASIRKIILALLVVGLSGCAFPRGGIYFIQQMPVKLIEQHEQLIEFTAKKQQTYFFDLHFEFNDSVDRARVASLVGSTHKDRSGNSFRHGGVPTPVHLSIRKVQGATGFQEVASFELDPMPTGFTRRSMGKNIGHALLAPGRYVAILTPMQTVNEFAGTRVEFVVFYDIP